jgi:hypothetical protein
MVLHSISGISRKLLLMSICIMGGGAAALAQTVTLKPVDTGRSVVTFDLGANSAPGRYALKTNLLYAGAALTPNLGFEFGSGGRMSLELSVGYKPRGAGYLWDKAATGPEWDIVNNYKTRLDHIFGRVELRRWFNEPFRGHFLGVNVFYGDYTVGDLAVPLLFERQFHYRGNVSGGAVSWGYLWRWSDHVGMEFTLSGGVALMNYDKSFIEGSTESWELVGAIDFRKTYIGPTAAGLKLVFMLK